MTTIASPLTLPELDLPGRVAVITGGTQGIGKEIARGLVQRGITVIIAARDPVIGGAAAAELAAHYHPLDVTDAASLAALVAHVTTAHGRLDVLINNAAAGILPCSPFELTGADVRRVYDTNVFAPIELIRQLYPLLARAPAGRIVNVSSERGTLSTPRVAFSAPPNMAYSSSKSALNAITQHYAHALAGAALKINAAAPGHCATAFNGFRGHRTPAEGARVAIALAVVGADGPNGGFFTDEGPAPW